MDSAFAVLEAVSRLGPGVTARQLTEALPMGRASVYRIIKHLVAQEYLVRTPDLRGFVIGERVVALARSSACAEPEGQPPDHRRRKSLSHLEQPDLNGYATRG